MKQIRLLTKLFLLVYLSFLAEPALAAVTTFNFTGTITSVSGVTFGLSPSIGDPVTGSFTYDPAVGWIQPAPSGMSVVISGVTIQSQNYNSFQVINNNYGIDDFNGYFTPISVNGNSQNGSMLFNFTDNTQTALSSTDLPTSLDFSKFNSRIGAIFDLNNFNNYLYFSIDVPPMPVKIDIKPGTYPNSINVKAKGKIPVAVLTTGPSDNAPSFDASTVDPASVRFGLTGTEASPVHDALEDVDGDGDIDMILHFNIKDTGIKCDNTSATLTGSTFDDQTIKGTDSIKAIGCR